MISGWQEISKGLAQAGGHHPAKRSIVALGNPWAFWQCLQTEGHWDSAGALQHGKGLIGMKVSACVVAETPNHGRRW